MSAPIPFPDGRGRRGRASQAPPEIAPQGEGGELVRLRPQSVLVLSADRTFRIVNSLLLTRRGCSVVVGRLIEPAGRAPADVALLDGGGDRETLARAVRIARGLAPSVGVVLVAEAPCADTEGLCVLPRWGTFADLFCAIRRAERRRADAV